MCGSPCDAARCRYASIAEIHDLLRPRCVRTRFHYAAVMALPPDGRRPLCLPCINWRRRSRRDRRFYHHSSSGGAHGIMRRVTYTPLDSILMFALQPGHTPEPDYRCLGRLARAAADPQNAFAALVPAQARAILQRVADEPPQRLSAAILRAWWEVNEGTVFFRSPGTARAVRAMVKRDQGILDAPGTPLPYCEGGP
jgi:hypothetical protein